MAFSPSRKLIFSAVGTFLLLCSFLFLAISTASAPSIHNVGFLKISVSPEQIAQYESQGRYQWRSYYTSSVFGTLGLCYLSRSDLSYPPKCSSTSLGYDIPYQVSWFDGTEFTSTQERAGHVLSYFLILNPIATAFTGLAFALAAASPFIGLAFSSIVTSLSVFLTLLAMIFDFVIFGIVKGRVNGPYGNGSTAQYSSAMWLVLVAFIFLLAASVTVCTGWITDTRKRRRELLLSIRPQQQPQLPLQQTHATQQLPFVQQPYAASFPEK